MGTHDRSDNLLGFYGVYRHRSREPENRAGIVYDETLDEFVVRESERVAEQRVGKICTTLRQTRQLREAPETIRS